MATWKAVERAVAATIGGTRIPVSGRARGDAPDIAHPLWSVEVKHRKKLPGFFAEKIEAAETLGFEGVSMVEDETTCFIIVTRLDNLRNDQNDPCKVILYTDLRVTLPALALEAVDQALASRKTGQVPLCVFHQTNQKISDSYVLVYYPL